MMKHKLNPSKLLSPLALIISTALAGVIFHDWEGFKAGFFGTYEPPLIVDYSSVILDSLLISLPIAVALYFSEDKKVKG